MITAHVKNFTDFLHGKEVTATVKNSDRIEQGQHVLAIKDSIAANIGITVPQDKLHEALGVEATVVSAAAAQNGNSQTVIIKKD